MTADELDALREELRTQDNACTAHTLYCVYDHHLTGRRKSTAPKDNWRFITACLTKKAAERYITFPRALPILGARRVQPPSAGTDRALPCRCRRGAD